MLQKCTQSLQTDTNVGSKIECIEDSNWGEPMPARCVCFNTSKRTGLPRVVCLHFIMHRQETGMKCGRETTAVPVSLEISLSELSHIQYTDTPSLCVLIQQTSVLSVGEVGWWLKKLRYLGARENPNALTCAPLYQRCNVKTAVNASCHL